MIVNISKIESALTKDNLSIVEEENKNLQGTKCPLTKDNLSIDKGQNDFIKDNIKDKGKDNILESNSASALIDSVNHPVVTVSWLIDNHIAFEPIEGSKNLVRIKSTGATVKVV